MKYSAGNGLHSYGRCWSRVSTHEAFKKWAIRRVCSLDVGDLSLAPPFLTGELWRAIHTRKAQIEMGELQSEESEEVDTVDSDSDSDDA